MLYFINEAGRIHQWKRLQASPRRKFRQPVRLPRFVKLWQSAIYFSTFHSTLRSWTN